MEYIYFHLVILGIIYRCIYLIRLRRVTISVNKILLLTLAKCKQKDVMGVVHSMVYIPGRVRSARRFIL
jgi:hypothetical protein